MTVTFTSIRAFQDCLLAQEKLSISPKGCLVIQDINAFTRIRKSILEVNEPETKDKNDHLIRFLEKLVSPLGKRLFFQLPKKEVDYRIGKDLQAFFPEGAEFSARKADSIFVRASELFALMVISSRLTLKLDANQQLCLIGLKGEVLEKEDALSDALTSCALPGFQYKNLPVYVTVERNTIERAGLVPKNSLCIRPVEAQGSVEISIVESSKYTYTEEEFIDRLLLQPQLKIPADTKLQIKGPFIRDLSSIWELEFEGILNPGQFILDQLFLPFGKNVLVKYSKFSQYGDTLEILLGDGSIELVDNGERFIDFESLGERMIRKRCFQMTVPANHRILIYSITEEEKESFFPPKKSSMDAFFLSKSPLGFRWSLSGSKQFLISKISINESGHNWLSFLSDTEMVFSLKMSRS